MVSIPAIIAVMVVGFVAGFMMAISVIGEQSKYIRQAISILHFYGHSRNYCNGVKTDSDKRSVGTASLVMQDKGQRAREFLSVMGELKDDT